MKIARLALGVIAATLIFGPGGAHAQDEMRLSLGYDGRLLVKVLDIEVQERVSASGFSAEAQLTSAGVLALVKHIHQWAQSQGRIVGGEPRPGVFETRNLGGKTRRQVRTVWSGGEVGMTAQPAFANLGDPPASLQQKLAAADPLTDLVRMTVGGSREKTCGRSYLFFDGKQLYALDFSAATDGTLSDREARLGLARPFRCDVRFREVAGFGRKPRDKANQGLQRPIRLDFAQIGADGPLVISALHADTPLGGAVIELSRLSVNGRTVDRVEAPR